MQTHSESKGVELYRMIYCSQIAATSIFGWHTLNSITQKAAKNNVNTDITGVLCYGNSYFLQYLEGKEQTLTDLKNKLILDPSHLNMKVLDFSMIKGRNFPNWHLQEIILNKWAVQDPAVKNILPFDPMSWDDKQFNYFIMLLEHKYVQMVNTYTDEQITDTDEQIPDQLLYKTLGMTVSNIVGRHQAFLAVQAVLGILIASFIFTVLFASQM